MQETISNLQNAVSKDQNNHAPSRYLIVDTAPFHFTKYLSLKNLPISIFNDINSLRFDFFPRFSKREAREILKNKKSLKIFVLRRLRFCHSTFRRENIQIANAPVYVCMHERTFLIGILYINCNMCVWIYFASLILKKFERAFLGHPQLRLGAEVQRLKHKRELKCHLWQRQVPKNSFRVLHILK